MDSKYEVTVRGLLSPGQDASHRPRPPFEDEDEIRRHDSHCVIEQDELNEDPHIPISL
jgi:hypothetical protein